uniref:Uncharacterized protein n=1 Tax=viral metagenome TaxID=1070528 RepID=A0A6M3XZH1_9ZZZZ
MYAIRKEELEKLKETLSPDLFKHFKITESKFIYHNHIFFKMEVHTYSDWEEYMLLVLSPSEISGIGLYFPSLEDYEDYLKYVNIDILKEKFPCGKSDPEFLE